MCLRTGGIHTRASGMPNANLKRRGAWVGRYWWMQAKQRHGETFSPSLRLVHLFMNYLGHFSNEWWERIRWRSEESLCNAKCRPVWCCVALKNWFERFPFDLRWSRGLTALKQIEIMRKWEELEKLQFNGKLRIIEWYHNIAVAAAYVKISSFDALLRIF